jgi:2-dehydropantoate 2-reductase
MHANGSRRESGQILILQKKRLHDAITAKVSQLTQSLKTAGLDAHVSDNIEQAMWNKWTLLTTIAAATCLMSANIGEICSTSHGAAFLKRLYEEVRSIAMAAGRRQDPALVATLKMNRCSKMYLPIEIPSSKHL